MWQKFHTMLSSNWTRIVDQVVRKVYKTSCYPSSSYSYCTLLSFHFILIIQIVQIATNWVGFTPVSRIVGTFTILEFERWAYIWFPNWKFIAVFMKVASDGIVKRFHLIKFIPEIQVTYKIDICFQFMRGAQQLFNHLEQQNYTLTSCPR